MNAVSPGVPGNRARRKILLWIIALAFALVGVAAFFYAMQSKTSRLMRLSETAQEISKGNYFAWAQARRWDHEEKLTPDERDLLRNSCRLFLKSKRALIVEGRSWPPENRKGYSPPRPEGAKEPALRSKLTALHYDRNLVWPAFNQIPISFFDGIFDLRITGREGGGP